MNEQSINTTIAALTENGFAPMQVNSKEEAFAKIKELVPAGATVMNGASVTLQEIGYIDYVKEGNHPWKNHHDAILAETDPAKQNLLRRESVVSDYYLGSAHAVTETGELIITSNSGSQLPHLAFTSPNIILVVGTQKIVSDLSAGLKRIQEDVIPLEDERMKEVYGYGTLWAKTLVLHKENAAIGRKVHVILVNEKLGF